MDLDCNPKKMDILPGLTTQENTDSEKKMAKRSCSISLLADTRIDLTMDVKFRLIAAVKVM
jgi:hypothetical protein